MTVASKLFNRLTFRCLCAVFIGALVVTLFSALLTLYGDPQEQVAKVDLQKTLKFPENEQMLKSVAAQLTREGERLSKIAPAAGDDEKEQTSPKN